MEPDLKPGSLVAGRFRLDRILGEGGMGVVWAATHTITRKPMALKLIKGAGEGSEHRSRLVREARAASVARHPNVCEVHDVIELEDGSPVMVMELLVGESLADRIERDVKLPLAELAGIFLPVVSAVGAAHALGIIHRDLKPANIFLTRATSGYPPGVKVLDFGIAKLTASEGDAAASGALTVTGSMLGTPSYMSPEQAFGEKDIDARTDVWALGLILYRCLSGILPTKADNLGQIFKNIVARPIRPLEDVEPDLPREVTALCARMLSRGRQHRPSDLHEVVAVLSPYTAVRVPDFPAPAALGVSTLDAVERSGVDDPLSVTDETSLSVSASAISVAGATPDGPFVLAGATTEASSSGEALPLSGGARPPMNPLVGDEPPRPAQLRPSTGQGVRWPKMGAPAVVGLLIVAGLGTLIAAGLPWRRTTAPDMRVTLPAYATTAALPASTDASSLGASAQGPMTPPALQPTPPASAGSIPGLRAAPSVSHGAQPRPSKTSAADPTKIWEK